MTARRHKTHTPAKRIILCNRTKSGNPTTMAHYRLAFGEKADPNW